jgi:isopentenyldiphosphate isomerase
MKELLTLVNDQDEVIGSDVRDNIHEKGLLHRGVSVYFVTPDKQIIFQHRSKDKRIYADLLDSTVGGGVVLGDSYEKTAIKETLEETGVELCEKDLLFIKKSKELLDDDNSEKICNSFASRYLYVYRGRMEDLKPEEGKVIGFESWPIGKLLNLNESERARFIPERLRFVIQDLADFIQDLKL